MDENSNNFGQDSNNSNETNNVSINDMNSSSGSNGSEFFHHSKDTNEYNGMMATNDSMSPNNRPGVNPNSNDNSGNNNLKNELEKGKNKNKLNDSQLSNKKQPLRKKDGLDSKKKRKNSQSNTLRKAKNNASNVNIDNKDSGPQSDSEKAVSSLGDVVAGAGDKALGGIKKGFKSLMQSWLKLPLSVKIISLSVFLFIVLFIIIMILFINSGAGEVDYDADEIGKVEIVDQTGVKHNVLTFIKGSFYDKYQNEDEDFIKALSILIKSTVYYYYDEQETYNYEEKLGIFNYNEEYDEFEDIINTIEKADEDEEVDISNNTLGFRYSDGTLYDKLGNEVDYSFIKAIDYTCPLYIETPIPITQDVVKKMQELSNNGKNYVEILIEITEKNDLEIYSELNVNCGGVNFKCTDCEFINPMCNLTGSNRAGHNARDFGAAVGTPVLAAADGIVILTQNHDVNYSPYRDSNGYYGCRESGLGMYSYGNLIKIDHGNGSMTAYAHLSKILVTNGQQVAQGDVIAEVGNTGCSDGPHLHFEIIINGTRVADPLPFVENITCS